MGDFLCGVSVIANGFLVEDEEGEVLYFETLDDVLIHMQDCYDALVDETYGEEEREDVYCEEDEYEGSED